MASNTSLSQVAPGNAEVSAEAAIVEVRVVDRVDPVDRALDRAPADRPGRPEHLPCLLLRRHPRLRQSFPVSTCTYWRAKLRIPLPNLRPLPQAEASAALVVRLLVDREHRALPERLEFLPLPRAEAAEASSKKGTDYSTPKL